MGLLGERAAFKVWPLGPALDQGGEIGERGDEEDPGEVMLI